MDIKDLVLYESTQEVGIKKQVLNFIGYERITYIVHRFRKYMVDNKES